MIVRSSSLGSRRLVGPFRVLGAGACAAALAALALPLGAAEPARNYSAVTDARLLSPEPRNWLMYRRTYDSWGYSPLDEITARNVQDLVPVWSASTGTQEGHQAPPIVNDGTMFVTTPFNQVLALDVETGKLREIGRASCRERV